MDKAVFPLAARLYRRYWRRLLFFSGCVAAGVAALVGIGSLLEAVRQSVAARARELMAGDIELSASRKLKKDAEGAIKKLQAEGIRSTEILSFASMLSTPGKPPFLVSVKAIGDGYPFYGRLETIPPAARPANNQCLLDESAARLHGLNIGDSVTLGGVPLVISALLVKEPDRTFEGFNLAPRLMVDLALAERSGLLQFGSRVRRARLLALPPGSPPEAAGRLKERLERELADPYLSISAYTEADASVRDTLERVSGFFVLLSLVALLLGAVGMSSSVTMFLNEQLETAAVLRCLGLAPRQVGQVYGLLCLALGVQGGLLGGAAGIAVSRLGLEAAVRGLGIAVPVVPTVSWSSLAEGLALSIALALALNAAKVAALARVSPADVLREKSGRLPPTRSATIAALVLGFAALVGYAFLKSNSWQAARFFALALAGSAAVVAVLIAAGLAVLRALAPALGRSFTLRHGLLALLRQRARTLVFLFTLSLGFSLLGALGLVHRSLTSEIVLGRSENVPDLFLIDIQKSQYPEISGLIGRASAFPPHAAPLIRARLTHIDGEPVAKRDLEGLTLEERARQRFLTREYNLTYKDSLQDSETLAAGRFWGPGEAEPLISLEESFSRRIGAGLGARLSFDVQGRPVEGTVTSLRRVDWMSMHPNFFVVFPRAALEPAPQTFIASLRVRDPEKAAAFQRELSARFPNVSVIDLSKVLDNVQSVLGTLISALDVLAWFCVAVGLMVLGGTLALGRRERLEQAALYRALGCGRRELLAIDAAEFAALGLLAFTISAATSHALAFAASRQMKIGFSPDPGTLLVMAAVALVGPVAVGLAVYWRAYGAGASTMLREE